jgi:hypothetical protein
MYKENPTQLYILYTVPLYSDAAVRDTILRLSHWHTIWPEFTQEHPDQTNSEIAKLTTQMHCLWALNVRFQVLAAVNIHILGWSPCIR